MKKVCLFFFYLNLYNFSFLNGQSAQGQCAMLQAALNQESNNLPLEISLTMLVPLCSAVDHFTQLYAQQNKVPLLVPNFSSKLNAVESLRLQSINALTSVPPFSEQVLREGKRAVQMLSLVVQSFLLQISTDRFSNDQEVMLRLMQNKNFFAALTAFFSAAHNEADCVGLKNVPYEELVEECNKAVLNADLLVEKKVVGGGQIPLPLIIEKLLAWAPYLASVGGVAGILLYLKNYLEAPIKDKIHEENEHYEKKIESIKQLLETKLDESATKLSQAQTVIIKLSELLEQIKAEMTKTQGQMSLVERQVNVIQEQFDTMCKNLTKETQKALIPKQRALSPTLAIGHYLGIGGKKKSSPPEGKKKSASTTTSPEGEKKNQVPKEKKRYSVPPEALYSHFQEKGGKTPQVSPSDTFTFRIPAKELFGAVNPEDVKRKLLHETTSYRRIPGSKLKSSKEEKEKEEEITVATDRGAFSD